VGTVLTPNACQSVASSRHPRKRCQASALQIAFCRFSPKSYPNLVGYIHPAVRLRVSANKTPIPKSSQMPTNSGANITGDGGNGTIDL